MSDTGHRMLETPYLILSLPRHQHLRCFHYHLYIHEHMQLPVHTVHRRISSYLFKLFGSVSHYNYNSVRVVVLKSCIYTVYGFGVDTFTRPEAQFAYDFPFAYFKGPPEDILLMSIGIATGEGTGIVIVLEVGNAWSLC